MRRAVLLALALFCLAAPPVSAADSVNPKADFKAFRNYFTKRFPNVPLNDFVNGPYSMDADLRKQWEEIDAFPPYQFALDKGKQMFETPFKNGKTYADCFPNKGIGIRQNYPYFDAKSGEVITLDVALNQCRQANGEEPLDYTKDDMAALTAYMAFTSRGKPFDIKIPNDPRALAAYRKGEEYFYTRRGQLNFSCASCHVQSAGRPYPHRGAGAGARHCRGAADLSLGMGRHGNDKPPADHLQQPGARRAAKAGGRALPRCRILSVVYEQRPADLRTGCTPMIVPGGIHMRVHALIRLAVVLTATGLATAALAASADDFKAAYAKAEAAENQAGALKNQWTTTDAELKAAKKAADAGNFDEAIKHAQQAEALANASIAQAKEQATAWKNAVIR